jgi:hypothetical protein
LSTAEGLTEIVVGQVIDIFELDREPHEVPADPSGEPRRGPAALAGAHQARGMRDQRHSASPRLTARAISRNRSIMRRAPEINDTCSSARLHIRTSHSQESMIALLDGA